MKAKIKSVDLGSDVGVFEYIPESSDCFSLWMNFTIGKSDSKGGDCFRLRVCTPEWLNRMAGHMLWGRHMLVVEDYRPEDIIRYVEQYVSSLEEESWIDIATKIARVMEWEFEDYAM